MQTNKNGRVTGQAVMSTFGVRPILQSISIEIYYIFEFLSFSIRFLVKEGLIHDNENDKYCLFHRHVVKSDIVDVIKNGYISLSVINKIRARLTLEQITSFQKIISTIAEIAKAGEPQYELQKYMEVNVKENTCGKQAKIFVSYSRKDKEWLERLKVHLKPLERELSIDEWDDQKMQPGYWNDQIQQKLNSATVAVLLLSADFVGSDFIVKTELPILLKACKDRSCTIIPILINFCRISKEIGELQIFNINSPLAAIKHSESEKLLVEVTGIIELVITQAKKKQT